MPELFKLNNAVYGTLKKNQYNAHIIFPPGVILQVSLEVTERDNSNIV